MPEIEVEVWCSCGEGLCNQTRSMWAYNRADSNGLTVEPCEKCLEKARDEGYDKGYEEGYEAAKEKYERSDD
jgi:flagellar biosynthesis/type III secretory pathway protein FliH